MASQIVKKSKTELQHTLKNNLEESVKIFNRLSEEQRKIIINHTQKHISYKKQRESSNQKTICQQEIHEIITEILSNRIDDLQHCDLANNKHSLWCLTQANAELHACFPYTKMMTYCVSTLRGYFTVDAFISYFMLFKKD